MKNIFFIAAVLWTYCLSAATKQPEQIIPVPFNEVTLTGGFWGERMQTELDVTLPFSLVQAGPAIEQLQGGADFLEGRGGQSISNNGPLSSDLYKIMEGAAYSLMLRPDPELEAKMDSYHRPGSAERRVPLRMPHLWLFRSILGRRQALFEGRI